MSANRPLTFGEWLKQRRKELGLAQEELSQRAGMSASMLRKLEAGERRPSGQIASLLAELLDIPPDERQAFITFSRIEQSYLATTNGDDSTLSQPWRSAHLRQVAIPFVLGTIVGRDEDERCVREHILDSKVRLLTMTGPPGIGKTRLALQVASGMADEFEDGVFFVGLASVVDPEMLIPAIARIVEINEAGEQPVEVALLNYLRSRKILLVLDNFEQLLDAALQLVRLMEGCPWLKVLVTSREALHVRGERRLPLLPLRLPDPMLYSESARSNVDWIQRLETIPSIQLFIEGARSVLPDFVLTEENALDVAVVCTRLEGLPLSIELASARVGHLSLSEMRAGLASRLKLLTTGARDLPHRHRTLRSAIEWSYSLLDETEQALFRRLGVFVGGFTVESVAAVCSHWGDGSGTDSAGPVYAADIADRLGSLVEKSLARKEERRRAGERGRESVSVARFGMLETLREFALDRLEARGELDSVRSNHARYYLALAERAENELEGANQLAWLKRLEEEHDNLRAAFEWAAETGAWEKGLRLAGALWRFWGMHGYDKEGIQRLKAWIAIARRTGLSRRTDTIANYAKALIGLGTLDFKLHGIEPALTLIEESVEIARRLDDKLLLALALKSLAPVYRYTDLAMARVCLKESLAIYREAGSKAGMASALGYLGVVALDEEELDHAQLILEESRDLWRSVGETVYLSGTLLWLGEVARSREDYRAAREAYEEALSLFRIAGLSPVYLMINLGHVAHSQQEYERSESLFAESLVLSFKDEDNRGTVACLAGLAATAAGQGQLQRAGKLFGAADALLTASGVRFDVADRLAYERHLAEAQARFERGEWEAAWVEGQRMSLEEAVAFAISI